jgi:hypothetical protein
MARQFRCLSLTLALGVLPLPGCVFSGGTRVPPPALTGVIDRPPEGGPPAQDPSPYHAAADGGVREDAARPSVARTGYTGRPAAAPRPQPEPPQEPPPPEAGPPPKLEAVPVARPPDEPLVAALRCYLDKRPEAAVEILNRYDPKNQEMLLRLLPLVVRCTESSLANAPPLELARLTEELEKVAEPVRALAPLEITKMVFCQEIAGFGNYKQLEGTPTFRAAGQGQPGERLHVYAEVRNFKSVPDNGFYVTRLASSVEVRDLDGRAVWRHAFKGEDDRSRTPRQDYFINYRFYVPPCLSPGQYVLSIQVRDALNEDRPAAAKSYDFVVK